MAEENQTNNTNTNANPKASKRHGKKQNHRGPRAGGNRNQKKPREDESEDNQQGKGRQQQTQTHKRKNHQRRRRGGDRRPWRKHIPRGTVDPITLEELTSLPYPPFALYAAGPYLPVPVWPPKAESSAEQAQPDEDPKLRERKLLQEQWGAAAALTEEEESKPHAKSTNHKSFNLFDGRALAYYMVSQLQFIDPLNRRDLTREELVHLDRYLARNGFDANVVEAYDTKGISLSMAGAASTTAAGRAQMLQEEAQVLLNSLFRPSSLAQQYNRYQQTREPQTQPAANNAGGTSSESDESDEDGWGNTIYGSEDGGMMVIDDDQNPSMRGGGGVTAQTSQIPAEMPELFPALTEEPTPTARPNNLWSGHRITGNQATNLRDRNFPLLATTKAKKGGAAKNKEAAGAQRERKLLEEQWGALRAGLSQPTRPNNNSRCTGGESVSPWAKLTPLNVQ